MSELRVNARGAHARCPLCHDAPEGELLACVACGATYHVECPDPARSPARCVVLGCQGTLAPAGAAIAPAAKEELAAVATAAAAPADGCRRSLGSLCYAAALCSIPAGLLVTDREAGLVGVAFGLVALVLGLLVHPGQPPSAGPEPTGLGAQRRDPPARWRRPIAFMTLAFALLVGVASVLVTPTEAGLPGYAVSALLFATAWVVFPEAPAKQRHASVVVSARPSAPKEVGAEPIGTPVGEAPPPSTAFPAMFDVARVDPTLPPRDAEAVRRRQGVRGVGNPKGLGRTL